MRLCHDPTSVVPVGRVPAQAHLVAGRESLEEDPAGLVVPADPVDLAVLEVPVVSGLLHRR